MYSSMPKRKLKCRVYFSSCFNTEKIVRHVSSWVTGLCGESCILFIPIRILCVQLMCSYVLFLVAEDSA